MYSRQTLVACAWVPEALHQIETSMSALLSSSGE
jgi:hypothetical protein